MACLLFGLTAGIVAGQGGDDGDALPVVSNPTDVVAASSSVGTRDILYLAQSPSTERALDEPPSTSLPPQGRTQVAAAEDSRDETGSAEDDARRVEGAAVLSVVSYSLLGEIVAAHPWPTSEAFAIVSCESNWTAGAISWTGARGLMQLMPVHAWRFARRGWDYWVDVFVPERNVAIAYELYVDWKGWLPWESSRNCWG